MVHRDRHVTLSVYANVDPAVVNDEDFKLKKVTPDQDLHATIRNRFDLEFHRRRIAGFENFQ